LILIKAVDTAHLNSDAGQLGILHYHHLTDNPKALKAVTATLDNMAFGGIYDQLGGGFRYSMMKTGWCPILKKCFMTMPN
jgi:uncharacterized protein YyaL (SSP411 family)